MFVCIARSCKIHTKYASVWSVASGTKPSWHCIYQHLAIVLSTIWRHVLEIYLFVVYFKRHICYESAPPIDFQSPQSGGVTSLRIRSRHCIFQLFRNGNLKVSVFLQEFGGAQACDARATGASLGGLLLFCASNSEHVWHSAFIKPIFKLIVNDQSPLTLN